MKILKVSVASVLLYMFFLAHSVSLVSCTKTNIEHDTTVINHHDTTIINRTDTLIVPDSIYSITDGLVAYYNFNGGNLNDSSGYGNNIVFSNATPTIDRFGNANNAFLFNGTSNYMYVKNASSLNPNNTITIMAIVKINGFYNGGCNVNQILGKGIDKTYGQYSLRFSDYVTNSCSIAANTNQETFSAVYASQIGTTSVDTSYIKTGVWYNLIFSYDGFEGRYFINGQLKKTWVSFTNLTPNTNNLYIGAYEVMSQFPYWFNGVIDEIRIYNRGLPYGAIKELNELKE